MRLRPRMLQRMRRMRIQRMLPLPSEHPLARRKLCTSDNTVYIRRKSLWATGEGCQGLPSRHSLHAGRNECDAMYCEVRLLWHPWPRRIALQVVPRQHVPRGHLHRHEKLRVLAVPHRHVTQPGQRNVALAVHGPRWLLQHGQCRTFLSCWHHVCGRLHGGLPVHSRPWPLWRRRQGGTGVPRAILE